MANANRKLHVTLIRGPLVFKHGSVNNEAVPAIAYGYIGGYLRKKGYETVLIDATGEGLNEVWALERYPGYKCQGLTFSEIIARIPKNTGVIGFSGMFSGEWPVLRDLITEVRKHFPKALFAAGGEHITALAEYSLRDCPALDVCIRGEGEHTFYMLLEAYAATGGFTSVNGVSYLDNAGYFRQNGEKLPRILNINDIPWPHWPEGYLKKFWDAGKSFGIATERDMPFMISRGCPYQCAFCSNTSMWTTRYILRDVNNVIEEIKHYMAQYNISSVQLYDLTAIVKKSWIVEFCRRLIKEGIKLRWSLPSGTRSEALDAETLGLLKKTGCEYLCYAPESGSARTLELVKKRVNLNQLTQSALEAKKQGLTVRTNLIIGFPGETWRDIRQTLFYGLKMAIKGIDEVPMNVFSPYPGTEIFRGLLNSGELILNDEYFFSLASLNSAYLSANAVSYNPKIEVRTLGIIRIIFLYMNYIVGYILYPHRIIRTLRNLFSNREATTVFEHRLNDIFKRKNSISTTGKV